MHRALYIRGQSGMTSRLTSCLPERATVVVSLVSFLVLLTIDDALTRIDSRDEVRALGWVLARGSLENPSPVDSSSLGIYPW